MNTGEIEIQEFVTDLKLCLPLIQFRLSLNCQLVFQKRVVKPEPR